MAQFKFFTTLEDGYIYGVGDTPEQAMADTRAKLPLADPSPIVLIGEDDPVPPADMRPNSYEDRARWARESFFSIKKATPELLRWHAHAPLRR